MAGPTIDTSMLGKQYAFKSLNANDPVFYVGTIVDIFTYQQATQYRNVLAYNQACRQTDPTIPVDPSQINPYFLLKLTDTTGSQQFYSFCSEWIMAGSWESLNVVNIVTVKVFSSTSDTGGILEALADAGYPNAQIESNTLVSS